MWIKEALGGTPGFLAGWMSWFAQAVAGSLYALAFGRFAAELISLTGVDLFGLSVGQLSLVMMTLVIIVFIGVNYWGASETATAGNVLTVTKLFILALLILFGLLAMSGSQAWVPRFSAGFLPNGLLSVFVAMGFTFIAFEGYEIIAQSGEEVINPKHNIPRAIFTSIGSPSPSMCWSVSWPSELPCRQKACVPLNTLESKGRSPLSKSPTRSSRSDWEGSFYC